MAMIFKLTGIISLATITLILTGNNKKNHFAIKMFLQLSGNLNGN